MKKVILVLFSLMLTSVAFSQVEGYLAIFERVSLIESKDSIWKVSDNRCFEINGETYVLAYEPLNFPIMGDSYNANVRDKDLYLYRKIEDGWEKASPKIRHDYFHWDKNSYPDSLQALDANVNKYNIRDGKSMCYGSIKIDSIGNVTIGLKTWIWKKGEPIMHPIYDDLILMPKGDKTYDFTLKRIK